MSGATLAEIDPRAPMALQALAQYYAELASRFPSGFEVSRSRDPDAADMIAPRGAFLIASADDLPLGCVGLARGQGLARRLMAAAEARARELGVSVLRLDTNRALPEAAALYRRLGWTEIERFNDDPYAPVFFEKRR